MSHEVEFQVKSAGILLGRNGGPDMIIHLVAAVAGEAMWSDALSVAASFGGYLPTRREWLLLVANLREEFKQGRYWTADHNDEDDAWLQYIYTSDPWEFDCRQLEDNKNAKASVVVIRRVPLGMVN